VVIRDGRRRSLSGASVKRRHFPAQPYVLPRGFVCRLWLSSPRSAALIGVSGGIGDERGRRQRSAQFSAGGDPELREHPVQVGADRAMREVQPLADLAVRQALCRKLSDLQFLCGQLIARLGNVTPLRSPDARNSRRACSPQGAHPSVSKMSRAARRTARDSATRL
jgi:hypothetical protein